MRHLRHATSKKARNTREKRQSPIPAPRIPMRHQASPCVTNSGGGSDRCYIEKKRSMRSMRSGKWKKHSNIRSKSNSAMKEEMRSHAVICGHLMRKATVRRENAFCERNMQKSRSTRSSCPQAKRVTTEMARKIGQFRPSALSSAPCGGNRKPVRNLSALRQRARASPDRLILSYPVGLEVCRSE